MRSTKPLAKQIPLRASTYGTYAWAKYRITDDDEGNIVADEANLEDYVVSDNETEYPDDGQQGNYWYRRIYDSSSAVYMLETSSGDKVYAQLASEEQVALTATANDIRIGTTAVTQSGVIEGEKDIPAYHTTTGYRYIPANTEFKIPLALKDR